MDDNLPHPDLPPFRPLAGMEAISLHGPDAVAFAQAQFANDVASLPLLHWQWSAWLTAKGRVIAIFLLLRTHEDQLLMLLPDGSAEPLATQMKRFVFRRKVVIEADAGFSIHARLEAPEHARGATAAAIGNGWELDMGGEGLPRALRITTQPRPADAADGFDAAWRQADLQLGLPRLGPTQREQWTPQQLGLDRLSAYSTRKGCYPGQEIVARTHFLGKAKRSTRLLQLRNSSATPGGEVHVMGRSVGTLVSVAGPLALAVMPLDESGSELEAAGAPATEIPVRAGLAR